MKHKLTKREGMAYLNGWIVREDGLGWRAVEETGSGKGPWRATRRDAVRDLRIIPNGRGKP